MQKINFCLFLLYFSCALLNPVWPVVSGRHHSRFLREISEYEEERPPVHHKTAQSQGHSLNIINKALLQLPLQMISELTLFISRQKVGEVRAKKGQCFTKTFKVSNMFHSSQQNITFVVYFDTLRTQCYDLYCFNVNGPFAWP